MIAWLRLRRNSTRLALQVAGYSADYFGHSQSERRRRRLAILTDRSRCDRILVVLASPRTGSTLFCNLMRQVEGCFNTTEVLAETAFPARDQLTSARAAAAHLRRVASAPGTTVGVVKVFYDDLRSLGFDLSELDSELGNARWVHLWREDLLAQYVSRQSALSSDQAWETKVGELVPERRRVLVSKDDYLEYRRRQVDDVAFYQDALQSVGSRATTVSYEQFTADPLATLTTDVCPLLGRPAPESLKEVFTKQTPTDYRHAVSNPDLIDELQAAGLHANELLIGNPPKES